MRRPLRVVYADHSRLEHHGVAAGDVAVVLLKCVKFPPWRRVSTPTGVAPEALEECLHSSKGYKRRPARLIDWGDCPASFQPASVFFVLVQWPVILLSNPAGACKRGRVH